jgi:hypothetical protein
MKYPFLRIPWRLVGLWLGFLLIAAVICALALPYLHDLIYPDSLSRNDLTPTGCETIGYAVFAVDRQIDELGAPDHIRTEADARAYVDALMKRWDPNETNPHLAEFEERLARAEYAAARNPGKWIPESQVAQVFNRLMDEWQMPGWTHISVAEFHAFRMPYTCAIYPKSVARLPNGMVAPSCQPTEALVLLHMLDANEGIASYIRDHVRENYFPWNALKRFKLWHPAAIPVLQPGLHPAPPSPDDSKIAEYLTLRRRYSESHPDASLERIANELFMQLRIAFSSVL